MPHITGEESNACVIPQDTQLEIGAAGSGIQGQLPLEAAS